MKKIKIWPGVGDGEAFQFFAFDFEKNFPRDRGRHSRLLLMMKKFSNRKGKETRKHKIRPESPQMCPENTPNFPDCIWGKQENKPGKQTNLPGKHPKLSGLQHRKKTQHWGFFKYKLKKLVQNPVTKGGPRGERRGIYNICPEIWANTGWAFQTSKHPWTPRVASEQTFGVAIFLKFFREFYKFSYTQVRHILWARTTKVSGMHTGT